mmetsp:Transcript_9578/g.17792  ORF Transcript_9578/g.17792 Transcript_9578/m.17792 type:complete len:278 (+) Transcript_9578:51-884(+)
MVRQEDVDSLFAKPGTARRHCFLLSACVVFDVTIYPLMIYVLFIDVPDFLQPPPGEEDERMFLFIKLGAVCGFTFVVCMYQVILFDLFGQHCSRMRQALSMERKPVSTARVDDAAGKHFDAWETRPEDVAGAQMQPNTEGDGVLVLPGALYPQHLGMPSIEETEVQPPVQQVAVSQARITSRGPSMIGEEQRRVQATARKYHSEGPDTASLARPGMVEGVDGQQAAQESERMDNSSKKSSTCLSGKTVAGKSHEKTVSFDRETVFTYIKQTPVQTPR